MSTTCPHCGGEFIIERRGHAWRGNTKIRQFITLDVALVTDPENGCITKRLLWLHFDKLTPKEIYQCCWYMVRNGYWKRVKINHYIQLKQLKVEAEKNVRQKDKSIHNGENQSRGNVEGNSPKI